VPHLDARKFAWLVLRAQSDDRKALAQLLEATIGELHPYIRAMMDDSDLAADVLQDTLVTIHRQLRALREPMAYSAWARRIASRRVFAALSRQRKRAALHQPLDESIPDGALDGPDPVTEELVQAVPALVSRVSPASREVVLLHYMSGLSLDEIATTLDIPVGTVKSRLGYGLRVMRRLLSEVRPSGQPAHDGLSSRTA
jgi:RNA polymerase sigma-70 factor (ECF subfamily)